MNRNNIPKPIFLMLAPLSLGLVLGGCGDDAPPTTGMDSGTDTTVVDGGADAGTDTMGTDTTVADVGVDAPADGGTDVTPDAGEDVATDVPEDTGMPDVVADAGTDVGVDAGPMDAGMDTPPADAGMDVPVAAMCPEGDIGMMLGDFLVTGTTVGASNSATPSCITRSEAPDMGYTFTAPADGRYGFNTEGSGLDTVLYVLDGAMCGSTELACNDDAEAGNFASAVAVDLTAGQTVVVMVDAWGTGAGRFVLSSERVENNCGDGLDEDADGRTDCDDSDCSRDPLCFELLCADTLDNDMDGDVDCADADCNGTPDCCADVTVPSDAILPVTYTGTMVGETDDYEPSACGGTAGPDRSYSFTAPSAGDYTFSSCSSTFDTVIALTAGTCDGMELGCSDDACGLQSSITRTMALGETVVVHLNAYSSFTTLGDYELIIAGP